MARVAFLITLVLALAAIVAAAGAAQDDPAMAPPSLPTVPGTPSAMMPRNLTCTSMLLTCMQYYQNSTAGLWDTLAEMCCAEARKVPDGETDCLCDGINNPTLVSAMSIDVNKGMGMFRNCDVKVPENVCSGSNAGDPAGSKSANGVSQGMQFSYSSFLVFLFSLWLFLNQIII